MIIAIDFDGTLVTDEWPAIGKPDELLIKYIKKTRDKLNAKLILWTCRDKQLLQEAVIFCREVLDLEFDMINDNLPECVAKYDGNSRKIYADLYIDDKSLKIKIINTEE